MIFFFKLDTPTVYASIPEKLFLPFNLTINLRVLQQPSLTRNCTPHSLHSQIIMISSLPSPRYSHAFGNVITLRVRVRRRQNTLSLSLSLSLSLHLSSKEYMSHANTKQANRAKRKQASDNSIIHVSSRNISDPEPEEGIHAKTHVGGNARSCVAGNVPLVETLLESRPATSNRPRHVQ